MGIYVDGGFASEEQDDEKFGDFTTTPAVIISFLLYLMLFMQTAKDNLMSGDVQHLKTAIQLAENKLFNYFKMQPVTMLLTEQPFKSFIGEESSEEQDVVDIDVGEVSPLIMLADYEDALEDKNIKLDQRAAMV